jgi:hypothetical protein
VYSANIVWQAGNTLTGTKRHPNNSGSVTEACMRSWDGMHYLVAEEASVIRDPLALVNTGTITSNRSRSYTGTVDGRTAASLV